MKTGLIILCRISSQRLPGKILSEIYGHTVLGHIVDRICLGAPDRPLVIATSTDHSDDPIADYCQRANLECFRGSLDDVSSRFLACSEKYGWDFAVRINGDNLFVDHDTLRAMLAVADTDQFDFVTNVPGRTFPRGMSIEIARVNFYAEVIREVIDSEHREHVTSWLYANPSLGRWYVFENRTCPEAAGLQLALDTDEDLALAQHILSKAGPNPASLGIKEIFKLANQYFLPKEAHRESC